MLSVVNVGGIAYIRSFKRIGVRPAYTFGISLTRGTVKYQLVALSLVHARPERIKLGIPCQDLLSRMTDDTRDSWETMQGAPSWIDVGISTMGTSGARENKIGVYSLRADTGDTA